MFLEQLLMQYKSFLHRLLHFFLGLHFTRFPLEQSSFTPWPSLPSLSEALMIRIPSCMHACTLFLLLPGPASCPHTSVCILHSMDHFFSDWCNFSLAYVHSFNNNGKEAPWIWRSLHKNRWHVYQMLLLNCFWTLLLEHTSLCHQQQPPHYWHKLGHFESEEFCAVMIHQNKYQHKCPLHWLKQHRDPAYVYLYHVYASLRFSFQIQQDPDSIKLARGLKSKALIGCKKYSWTIQEPRSEPREQNIRGNTAPSTPLRIYVIGYDRA